MHLRNFPELPLSDVPVDIPRTVPTLRRTFFPSSLRHTRNASIPQIPPNLVYRAVHSPFLQRTFCPAYFPRGDYSA